MRDIITIKSRKAGQTFHFVGHECMHVYIDDMGPKQCFEGGGLEAGSSVFGSETNARRWYRAYLTAQAEEAALDILY